MKKKKKIILIIVLFFGAAFFWSEFDQAGSSFNIFTKEYTDRIILGWEYPAGWLQSVKSSSCSYFIPFYGLHVVVPWQRWQVHLFHLEIWIRINFHGNRVSIYCYWSHCCYARRNTLEQNGCCLPTYFHTIGELAQSNWACNNIKLSPKRFVGQMMGIWFLAALGAIVAGLLSGQATYSGISSMPDLFNKIAIISSIIGLVLILISKPLNN